MAVSCHLPVRHNRFLLGKKEVMLASSCHCLTKAMSRDNAEDKKNMLTGVVYAARALDALMHENISSESV